jgi:serine/threonine-protein kinase
MIGEVVGNYRVTGQIGFGGMGAVYEAQHQLLGNRVAVKVLLPERSANREIVQRFFNEAKAVSLVHHPGIPELFDFGHLASGNAYIIMELLEGETLGERLKRVRPMSPNESVSISRHIAGTLSAAHAHGIVHRDLKPDNVFLVPDPALPRGERAKILDFGIAKLADSERPSKVRTETGRLMGTPYYMSPEQCRGSGRVDHRSDIYSLGCVLYQMLTGRPPFVLEGSGEVLAAHIHVPPLSPRTIVSAIPTEIEAVVMKLLAKDPAERYQTMDEVIHGLNQSVPRTAPDPVDSEPSLQASTHLPARRPTSAAPRERSTTLGSSASESQRTIPEHRRGGHWLTYVGLLAAAAVASFFVFRAVLTKDAGGEPSAAAPAAMEPGSIEPSPSSPSSEAPAARQDTPLVEPMAAEGPEYVTLLVESDPDGAVVYRESDGVKIGTTPVRYRVRRGPGEAVFILKKRGYRSESLVMDADEDDAFMVELHRWRPSAPEPAAKGSTAAKGPSASRPPAAEDKKTGGGEAKKPPARDAPIDPFKLVP